MLHTSSSPKKEILSKSVPRVRHFRGFVEWLVLFAMMAHAISLGCMI